MFTSCVCLVSPEVRKGVGSPGNGATDRWMRATVVSAGVDQGPLQEQVLTTAEPWLQPHMVSFSIRCWLHECIRFVQVKLGAHSLLQTLQFTYQFLEQLPLWNTLLRGGRASD